MPTPECATPPAKPVTAAITTPIEASTISAPSTTPLTCSNFWWPNGCSRSAGRSARWTVTAAISEASRSVAECAASARTAADPVMTATTSLSTTAAPLEATLSHAARDLRRLRSSRSRADVAMIPRYGTSRRRGV